MRAAGSDVRDDQPERLLTVRAEKGPQRSVGRGQLLWRRGARRPRQATGEMAQALIAGLAGGNAAFDAGEDLTGSTDEIDTIEIEEAIGKPGEGPLQRRARQVRIENGLEQAGIAQIIEALPAQANLALDRGLDAVALPFRLDAVGVDHDCEDDADCGRCGEREGAGQGRHRARQHAC